MPIHFSAWLILGIPVYCVILVFAIGAAAEARRVYAKILAFVLVLLVLGGLANGLSYAGSANSNNTPLAHASDVAKVFGLESGRPYPLVLGERLGGSAVSARAAAGWFTATASVNTQPGSAVSVSFTQGDKSYILELPTAKVTFVQSKDAQPSVAIYLGNATGYPMKVTSDTGCTTIIESGFLACRRVVSYGVSISDDDLRHGLPPIVQGNLDSATITLTPDMYGKVLGKIG